MHPSQHETDPSKKICSDDSNELRASHDHGVAVTLSSAGKLRVLLKLKMKGKTMVVLPLK